MNKSTVTEESIEQKIKHTEIVTHITKAGQVLRWAVLTMENGFAITGDPSCAVDSANDDMILGTKIAIDNAKQKVWILEGYLLKDKLQYN